MKRRDFMTAATIGTAGVVLDGCAAFGKKVTIKPEQTPIDLDKQVPRPQGTMPTGEIGKTGIRVSKFGFGSHLRQDLVKMPAYQPLRERMVHEAYDLGCTFFDVYDYEQSCFQYEPMGRYLRPMKNDVTISITMWPYEGRTVEQELERDLRLFGRDTIDMVRIHAWKNTTDEKILSHQLNHKWEWWETLFRLKEQGKIRAVGVPVHTHDDLALPLSDLPLDYVILPYNFYHNYTWTWTETDDLTDMIPKMQAKGIGVIVMKPFAGDSQVTPFKRLAAQLDETGKVNYAKACLRYILNSGLPFDAVLAGMYNPFHVYENIDAFYHPAFSDEEKQVLGKVRKTAKLLSGSLLPSHYRFLEDWAPSNYDDRDLSGRA